MKRHKPGEESTVEILGVVHSVTPILDEAGRIVHHAIDPLMVEIHARDLAQIVVGAAILSIPVSLTEEVWQLGAQLSGLRVIGLAVLSLVMVAAFVYCSYYQNRLREHGFLFVVRIVVTYLVALLVAATLLTIVDRCPWGVDNILALKRVVIVAFPASMSATLSDSLR